LVISQESLRFGLFIPVCVCHVSYPRRKASKDTDLSSMYGTTTYTVAVGAIPEAFGVSQRVAVLGFTMPFFGVFFAPIYTPHLSERYGRRPIYFTSFPLFCLCVIVIGLATNVSTLLAFRFLAGLFGGPCVVLIEGTFADVWSANKTVTYYSFLTLASYLGAAAGMV
jgi:MFS family permease